MGISRLQNFRFWYRMHAFNNKGQSINVFACKNNNEYLSVVYNGTFGAHHFCVEYLCVFVFIDIGTLTSQLLPFENTIVNKHATQHWLCLRF